MTSSVDPRAGSHVRAFIDTNILVYAFDAADKVKQRKAERLLSNVLDNRTGVLSVQVLKDFVVTVTRKIKKPMPLKEAIEIVEAFEVMEVVDDTLELFRIATALSAKHALSLWDACIVSAAIFSECQTLLSEDLQHGQRYQTVSVHNPFL